MTVELDCGCVVDLTTYTEYDYNTGEPNVTITGGTLTITCFEHVKKRRQQL
ncbi:hypothetical protein BJD55_gp034 [Gordonia phage Yvonnetastic]|uniref:Uncharacterized protein n=1 Tax=Gordonia phage Yvonnetastic TaxID=1821566 RepID=A0A142K9E9_9CAUD|nr:hypothetical protein BJD55_gp034 [Gordonia phage Yvonnetastic]AMS02732.1 hypothetical protein SEA_YVONNETASTIC_188 [Gordonia phage Yvonnetastic]